jgi:predicted O-methyltransferase YrrM
LSGIPLAAELVAARGDGSRPLVAAAISSREALVLRCHRLTLATIVDARRDVLWFAYVSYERVGHGGTGLATERRSSAMRRRATSIRRRIAQLPPRLRWAGEMLRLTARDPSDGWDWTVAGVRGSLARDDALGSRYVADPKWHARLHERLGTPWPCTPMIEFDQLWLQISEEVRASGLTLGRGTYGGWDDGDPCLARAIWCLICHLRPEKVVETGVARGVTSRVILEALNRAGAGHLWSIDLLPIDPDLREEMGVAVPERLRSRWTYVMGTSRRRLPKLLSEIAPIDLFVHDSSHTERNVLFELTRAWPALRRGAIVADDVHQSAAFEKFLATAAAESSSIVEADDASALIGIVLKTA